MWPGNWSFALRRKTLLWWRYLEKLFEKVLLISCWMVISEDVQRPINFDRENSTCVHRVKIRWWCRQARQRWCRTSCTSTWKLTISKNEVIDSEVEDISSLCIFWGHVAGQGFLTHAAKLYVLLTDFAPGPVEIIDGSSSIQLQYFSSDSHFPEKKMHPGMENDEEWMNNR